MKASRLLSVGMIAVAIGVGSLCTPFLALRGAYAAEGVRPEIGKPLQAAQDAVKKGNFKAAMDEVNKAAAVAGKTPAETLLVEQMRQYVFQQSGDTAGEIKADETLLQAGGLDAPIQLRLVQRLAELYYGEKDYPKAIVYLTRYRKEGGNDPALRALLIQAYFAAKDCANATKEQLDQIGQEEKSGQPAPEAQYQLLLACYSDMNDTADYVATLERTVVHYPKTDYWLDLIHRASTKPGYATSRLGLDLFRLKIATGTMRGPDDYREMTQTDLQENLPSEAKIVIDKGFAAGLLGKDEKAPRDMKLRDLVNTTVTSDQAAIDGKAAAAMQAKDGQAMLDIGFDYVGYGQFDKGLALMEDGVRTGGQKHPEDGKLHLALAYLDAGQKPKALAMLKTVGGDDGTAELARVMLLVAQAKPAS
jgi:tetratricopeptide (TPR) repeat protein